MWKIKDPKLKQWVNRFFSDEKIDKACRAQLEDGAFCVSLHDLGKGVFLDLSNRVFLGIQEVSTLTSGIPILT